MPLALAGVLGACWADSGRLVQRRSDPATVASSLRSRGTVAACGGRTS